MLTIIITTAHEPHTIGQAIAAFATQDFAQEWELLVVCPDEATAGEVARLAADDPRIRRLRDQGRGKPAALNVALGVARGTTVILSDGDVHVGPGAVQALLRPLEDPQVGIVSGRPMSLNDRDSMLGYWSHLLTDAGAHRQRLERDRQGEYLECSGYLYAFRRELVSKIPTDTLAEDGLISYMVWRQGYRTAYAPEAEVWVRFPTTYSDWIRQKVRTAGGYAQGYLRGSPGIKSFRHEAIHGVVAALGYACSLRELVWTLTLFGARLHVWARVLWDVKIRHRPFEALWKRVNSTKG